MSLRINFIFLHILVCILFVLLIIEWVHTELRVVLWNETVSRYHVIEIQRQSQERFNLWTILLSVKQTFDLPLRTKTRRYGTHKYAHSFETGARSITYYDYPTRIVPLVEIEKMCFKIISDGSCFWKWEQIIRSNFTYLLIKTTALWMKIFFSKYVFKCVKIDRKLIFTIFTGNPVR